MSLEAYINSLGLYVPYLGDSANGEIEINRELKDIERWNKSHPPKQRVGTVFEDDFLVIFRDLVTFPSGAIGTYLRVVERAALTGTLGVVFVPFFNGEISLIRIFRHATRRWELELPRGLRPVNLSSLEAVREEARQEIGCSIKSINKLGEITPNSGLLSGTTEVFWVELSDIEVAAQPESSEAIHSRVSLSFLSILEMVKAGEIIDAFTLSALQLAIANGYLKCP